MGKLYYGKLAKDSDAVAVIMAGGQGTRFWPKSRRSFPKQYMSLTGDGLSLIQQTAERVKPLTGEEGVLVVTAERQRALVEEHLPRASILAEPCPRNTAPCVVFAALKVMEEVGDVPMLCLPADHIIEGSEQVLELYRDALSLAASEDVLITIGIRPTQPETGYGYIQCAESYGEQAAAYRVKQFVEKPDLETAKQYLDSGEFFWNSGMFVWRPSVILKAISDFLPQMAEQFKRIKEHFGAEDEREQIAEIFAQIEPVSIDVGVMEKAENAIMFRGETFEWNDIGSWSSWIECLETLTGGEGNTNNIVQGQGILVNTRDCALIGDKRLIAAVGLKDLVIVDTDDALLVCHKDSAQDVKKVVEELSASGKEELL